MKIGRSLLVVGALGVLFALGLEHNYFVLFVWPPLVLPPLIALTHGGKGGMAVARVICAFTAVMAAPFVILGFPAFIMLASLGLRLACRDYVPATALRFAAVAGGLVALLMAIYVDRPLLLPPMLLVLVASSWVQDEPDEDDEPLPRAVLR
jgi:hypothetical protein